jgi:TonB family protein
MSLFALILIMLAQPPKEGPRRATSEGPLQALFTAEDYPARAARRGIEGTVGFRIEVDSTGGATNCQIISTSGNADLDQAACNVILQRARFRPALDHLGRPMPDSLSARIVWRLDGTSPYWSFEREQMVMTIRWSDPDPVCLETVNGEPMGQMGASECNEMFGPIMLAVRDGRGAFEVTIVDTLTPSGQSQMSAEAANYGELVWAAEVELAIAPNGHVDSCHATSSETDSASAFPFLDGAGICQGYDQPDARFEPVKESTGTRRAHKHVAVFVRRRNAG